MEPEAVTERTRLLLIGGRDRRAPLCMQSGRACCGTVWLGEGSQALWVPRYLGTRPITPSTARHSLRGAATGRPMICWEPDQSELKTSHSNYHQHHQQAAPGKHPKPTHTAPRIPHRPVQNLQQRLGLARTVQHARRGDASPSILSHALSPNISSLFLPAPQPWRLDRRGRAVIWTRCTHRRWATGIIMGEYGC